MWLHIKIHTCDVKSEDVLYRLFLLYYRTTFSIIWFHWNAYTLFIDTFKTEQNYIILSTCRKYKKSYFSWKKKRHIQISRKKIPIQLSNHVEWSYRNKTVNCELIHIFLGRVRAMCKMQTRILFCTV